LGTKKADQRSKSMINKIITFRNPAILRNNFLARDAILNRQMKMRLNGQVMLKSS